MPSTPCPKCNKANLVRLKMLRAGHPQYGKEYEACSRCNSHWFLDDPNRPLPPPDAKPKTSIWEKLGTWGGPDKIPDSFGQIHPATYVCPPVHDYPPVLFPPLDELRPTFAAPPPPPPPPAHSPPVPPSPVPPPPPPPDLELPPPPPPLLEMPTPEPFQPESHHAPTPEPEPAPPEPHSEPEPEPLPEPQPEPEPEPQLEQEIMSLQDHYDQEEEQARYERLMRIANSPGGPLPTSADQDGWFEHDQSYNDHPQEQHSLAGTEPPQLNEDLSPDEQQLRDTLRRVVATPRPPSPMGYAGSSAGGRTPHMDTGMGPPADEEEIARYSKHISERLDAAIEKSPFISNKDCLRTPRSAFSEAPRQTRPHTPAAARSSFNTPRHSVLGTPRAPSAHADQDGVPLPGGFPTPKSVPLTTAAVEQLGSQSSYLNATIRTYSRSGSLPCPPSHHAPSQRGSVYGSRAGSRAGKRVSIAHTGGSQSPLFS